MLLTNNVVDPRLCDVAGSLVMSLSESCQVAGYLSQQQQNLVVDRPSWGTHTRPLLLMRQEFAVANNVKRFRRTSNFPDKF